MSFSLLALVVSVGLLGPLLAARAAWRIPVVIGELAGGLLIGASGLRLVNPHTDTFALLANIGFGLTMVVAGSRIPVRDAIVRSSIGRGAFGAVLVGIVAVAIAVGISAVFGTGHAALYSVLIASSSAALVLPMLQSAGLGMTSIAQVIAQIAVADLACVIALPLILNPGRALQVAIAGLIIAVIAVGLGVGLIAPDRTDLRRRMHAFSERRRFALELRISLLILFALAAIAQFASVSILVAGFALGLVLSAAGEPHRLDKQLFSITEGFFGPLFFVWLGASIDLRGVAAHPGMILLGVALGASAVAAHLAGRIVGLPWLQAVASAGQLGVPVAAVTLGIQTGVLRPGEDAGILLGALITVAVSAVATGTAARPRPSASVRPTPARTRTRPPKASL